MTHSSRLGDGADRLRFSGKAFLVTGAARGIGEAVARRLAADGAAIAAADLDADRLAALARTLEASAGQSSPGRSTRATAPRRIRSSPRRSPLSAGSTAPCLAPKSLAPRPPRRWTTRRSKAFSPST